MSTLLDINSGNPFLHMTSDVKTKTQLEAAPGPNTVFHSDLPYIFVREQFEITSYTTWSGGRKFALPTALKDFRVANPDLAYLLLLEDSSGSQWLIDPIVDVKGFWFKYHINDPSSWVQNYSVAAMNGASYQVAYTKSDAELASLTNNSVYPSIALTFRPWATDDTHVTLFKTPHRHCRSGAMFLHHEFDFNRPGAVLEYMTLHDVLGPTNLRSSGIDVVKVRFVFLNVVHTADTFERQKGFAYDRITIDPDQFKVNSIDLAEMTPLVSHGFKTSGSTITPYTSGKVVSGKGAGVNMSDCKIDSTSKLINGNAPVLEVPPDPGSLTGWNINLGTQVIERNGVEVFNATWAARALFVSGSREIDFSTSCTLYNTTTDTEISSTQEGDLGAVDADTVYLASVVQGANKLHSTSVMSANDNMIAYFTLGAKDSNALWAYSNNLWFYLRITSAGVVTVRRGWNPGSSAYGNQYNSITSVAVTLPDVKIRLIALKTI